MNNYAIYLLLLSIFIAESLGCASTSGRDRNAWKKDHEKVHMDAIHSIVNDVVDRVKKYSDEMGTLVAQNCYDESKQILLDLSSNGENEVTRCIETADTETKADNCCFEIQSIVGEESTKVALTATRCIDNAKLSYRV